LLERPLDVPADAGPRDAELRRDLLVGLALLHQPQDVGLAPGDLEARNREHGGARSLLVAGGALDRGDDVGDLADHLVDHAAQEVDLRALGLRLGEQRGALDRVAEPLGERPEDVAVVRADVAPREVAVGVDEADDHVLGDERSRRVRAGPRRLHERLEAARVVLRLRHEHGLARVDHLGLHDVVVDPHAVRLAEPLELRGPRRVPLELHALGDHLGALQPEEHGAVETALLAHRARRAVVELGQRPGRAQLRPRLRWTGVLVAVLDGPPERERLIAAHEWATRLLTRLRKRVVEDPLGLAAPRWVVDRDFDLAYHLRFARLPEPGTMQE